MDHVSGYCAKCDTVWAAPGRCKCDTVKVASTDIKTITWNAAIEAAANKIEGAVLFANEIRKLKK